jgi:hypothetical protein
MPKRLQTSPARASRRRKGRCRTATLVVAVLVFATAALCPLRCLGAGAGAGHPVHCHGHGDAPRRDAPAQPGCCLRAVVDRAPAGTTPASVAFPVAFLPVGSCIPARTASVAPPRAAGGDGSRGSPRLHLALHVLLI